MTVDYLYLTDPLALQNFESIFSAVEETTQVAEPLAKKAKINGKSEKAGHKLIGHGESEETGHEFDEGERVDSHTEVQIGKKRKFGSASIS